jgi:protein-S-isoprenylcysteine O-methyltransferase Ste14
MIQIISAALFAAFVLAYFSKIALLRVRGIRSYQLGKKDKISTLPERMTFVSSFYAVSVWACEIIIEPRIAALPAAAHGLTAVSTAGLIVTAAGLALFCGAMIAMKDSWRVGIDTTKRTKLVETGLYAYSRNPAFAGLGLIFAGVFISFPDIFTAAGFAMLAVSMYRLAIKEEEHWIAVGGRDYERYRKRVNLFFGRVRL